MALRAWFHRAAGVYSQSQAGIRALKPWQHGTINIWITHYYGRPRPYLYDVGQEMSVRAFASRLKRAKEFFDFVPISELFANTNPRAVALTFDDGLDLEREGVLDVLDRLEVRATFYLMTASLDNKHLMWRNALSAMGVERDPAAVVEAYSRVCDEPLRTPAQGASAAMQWAPSEIDERTATMWQELGMSPIEVYLGEHQPYFTWNQVKQLMAAGHEIGCHTATHPVCSHLTEAEVEREIYGSARLLKERLNLTEITFAFPFGRRLQGGSLAQDAFTAVLGTGGASQVGSDPSEWERLDVEMDWDREVYRRPGAELLLRRLRKKV